MRVNSNSLIGVIIPSKFEWDELYPKIKDIKGIHCVNPGMGKVRTILGCHELMELQPKIKFAVLVGFAASLTPTLLTGDLIEPNEFIEMDYKAEPLEGYPNKLKKKHVKILNDSLECQIVTQDKFITENPLGELSRELCIAYDMESYAFAYFCNWKRVRYTVLKIISDEVPLEDIPNNDAVFLESCKRYSQKLADYLRRVTELIV